jgi:protein SCO1
MKKGLVFIVIVCLSSCMLPDRRLPILGNPAITSSWSNGKVIFDTTYPVVPAFSLTDQDSLPVNEKTFYGHVYVVDFIFLSCPGICPIMTDEMERTYRFYEHNDHVMFLSHTIDPERDTIPRLKAYADNLHIDNKKWKFVTGNQDTIYQLAYKGYYAKAYKDSSAPGGYIHSGGFLLIDKNRHIRGVYDGTDRNETFRLINDISLLLKEPS